MQKINREVDDLPLPCLRSAVLSAESSSTLDSTDSRGTGN